VKRPPEVRDYIAAACGLLVVLAFPVGVCVIVFSR
jgi:hypothetical protein